MTRQRRAGDPERQLATLMALLRDGSRDHPARGSFPPRQQAVHGLVALGSAAVAPLCAALQDPDGYTRRFAAEALARIGDARAVEPLISALRESETYVQRHVADALAKIGDARAVAPLCAALSKPRIAREALHALSMVLARTAINAEIDDLLRVANLPATGRALVEVPDTDGGYLAWNEVEEQLDFEPLKQRAHAELARRGLSA